MCDSYPITITVTQNMVDTEIFAWDMNPKSGSLPLTVTFTGFIHRVGYIENRSDSVIVDEEAVQLQQYDPTDNQWKSVMTVITSFNAYLLLHGYIQGTVSFSPNAVAGTYQFRLHYDGNTGKGLAGCEKSGA